MACVWYVCGRRGKLGGEQGRLHRGKGAGCRRLNVAVVRNVARPEGHTVLHSIAGEKELEAPKKKKMEGGRSGRILRNKRGRATKAAGCGDFMEKPTRGEMRAG